MILVVDDHADTCAALVALLRGVGLDGACADGGPSALAMLEAVRPEAIVLDNQMPGMSGIEVLRAIRAMSRMAGVPVLIYSAYLDADAIREARELGVTDWLVKGCDGWGDVLSGITNALKGGEAR